MHFKPGPRHLALPFTIALGVLAAACSGMGGGAGSGGYGAPNPPAKVAPQVVVKTAKVQVGGQAQLVVTDGRGRTLYYFLPEKDAKAIACTGFCLNNWRPVLLPKGGKEPSSSAALPGEFGEVARPGLGGQVTYDEWPLYTFAGDSGPGQAHGQGFGGQWFVVLANMPQDVDNDHDGTQPASPAPTATPAPAPANPAPAPAAPGPASHPPTAAPAATPPPPSFNDGDGDNNGQSNDGDGNG